ncbi:MAG: peptidyl-prolyl cis-trans isomerase [Marinilabiliales bacterium]|nr:peptidyl-prolyl cis-trans isomerase [Marinilabiliales bacterium]
MTGQLCQDLILKTAHYKLARIVDIAERPDSVRAAHILLSPNAGRSMAQARKEADSLMQARQIRY